jgi:hypothetical protein
MITIVRVDGLLMIGDMAMNCMSKPRVISADQQGMLYFQQLVGNPNKVYLDGPSPVRYTEEDVEEQALIKAYREHVSGIVIAQTVPNNVIDIGVKK